MKITALSLLIFLNCNLFGQVQLCNLNFEEIPYKKVRNYVETQVENHRLTMHDLCASLEKSVIPLDFSSQDLYYYVNADINTVWKSYVYTNPAELWNGKRLSFGLLFSKPSDKVVYRSNPCEKVDTGQIVILNLRLLRGIYNLAMAFEIINVDKEKRIIEFSYIKGNKSKVKQCIQFFEMSDGRTEIIHSSYFKSDSEFRDKYIYPFFHKRATNEFHRNMRRIIRKNQG